MAGGRGHLIDPLAPFNGRDSSRRVGRIAPVGAEPVRSGTNRARPGGLGRGTIGGVAVIALLHGPNLNLLGQREPHIYGSATLSDYEAAVTAAAAAHGHSVTAFQTNHEGELVDAIHRARTDAAAIIINPGAFTHYAWSLHDALAAFAGPVIEVHISNPNAREPWRHTSVVSPVATGSIMGLGLHGYELAVEAIARKLA